MFDEAVGGEGAEEVSAPLSPQQVWHSAKGTGTVYWY